jgi:hypothetical protein
MERLVNLLLKTPTTKLFNQVIDSYDPESGTINQLQPRFDLPEHEITPLHAACMVGNVQKIMALIALGADCNVKDSIGLLPVETAALYGHYKLVMMFIRGKIYKYDKSVSIQMVRPVNILKYMPYSNPILDELIKRKYDLYGDGSRFNVMAKLMVELDRDTFSIERLVSFKKIVGILREQAPEADRLQEDEAQRHAHWDKITILDRALIECLSKCNYIMKFRGRFPDEMTEKPWSILYKDGRLANSSGHWFFNKFHYDLVMFRNPFDDATPALSRAGERGFSLWSKWFMNYITPRSREKTMLTVMMIWYYESSCLTMMPIEILLEFFSYLPAINTSAFRAMPCRISDSTETVIEYSFPICKSWRLHNLLTTN